MFPVTDWQFWAVSVVVLGVIIGAGWSLIRKRKGRGTTRVQLTVERHTLEVRPDDEAAD